MEQFGRTEPRLWTQPLRPLTRETSLGFEVIDFAHEILHVELFPWQEWLLIHALEILEDGSYRFRRVVVLIARQNGKTTLASILECWWLFMDSTRHRDRVPPVKFKVVGVAQNLDIAREPWTAVRTWCDPEPATPELADLALPALQRACSKVEGTHGQEAIVARNRARYEVRAAPSARGKPTARVMFDELREEKTWTSWNAVSQTSKALWSSQMWAISNAGDASAVVLKGQREAGLAAIAEWDRYVGAGLMGAEEFAAGHDVTVALFEWSAPDDCDLDDEDAILQANPSVGYNPALTVPKILSDRPPSMTEAGYRTEVLCQWVTANVESFIPTDAWKNVEVKPADLAIEHGSRTVWGVSVAADRSMTWLAAAVMVGDRPLVTVRTRRAGMLWLVPHLVKLAERSGMREVALRGRGAPVAEFVEPLQEAGLDVHVVDGSHIGLATGRFRDRVTEGLLLHVPQPDVDLAVAGGVVKRYADNLAWDLWGSRPVDIAPVDAETVALYGLETVTPAVHEPVEPPPQAEIVTTVDGPELVNLAEAQF